MASNKAATKCHSSMKAKISKDSQTSTVEGNQLNGTGSHLESKTTQKNKEASSRNRGSLGRNKRKTSRKEAKSSQSESESEGRRSSADKIKHDSKTVCEKVRHRTEPDSESSSSLDENGKKTKGGESSPKTQSGSESRSSTDENDRKFDDGDEKSRKTGAGCKKRNAESLKSSRTESKSESRRSLDKKNRKIDGSRKSKAEHGKRKTGVEIHSKADCDSEDSQDGQETVDPMTLDLYERLCAESGEKPKQLYDFAVCDDLQLALSCTEKQFYALLMTVFVVVTVAMVFGLFALQAQISFNSHQLISRAKSTKKEIPPGVFDLYFDYLEGGRLPENVDLRANTSIFVH